MDDMDYRAVRSSIIEYLRRELEGPRGPADETIDDEPYRRYTTGILYPQLSEPGEILNEDEPDEVSTTDLRSLRSGEGAQGSDPVSMANDYLPASMGLSFFVETVQGHTPELSVRAEAGIYEKLQGRSFRRKTLDSGTVGFRKIALREQIMLWDSTARLHVVWRQRGTGWLVTVCLVNEMQSEKGSGIRAERCLHQAKIKVSAGANTSFARYPTADVQTGETEEAILELLYRREPAYATGHGCSAGWAFDDSVTVTGVYTEYMPQHSVTGLTFELPGFDDLLSLDFLADENNAPQLIGRLRDFSDRYRQWIDRLPSTHIDIPSRLMGARDQLLQRLLRAADRIDAGIYALQTDATILRAFRLANRAMADQMRHATSDYAKTRKKVGTFRYTQPTGGRTPRWRPFQLAFLLLVMTSVADDEDEDRRTVDLIWFPTGGGKTEAYLGVTAFLLILRRLRDPIGGGAAPPSLCVTHCDYSQPSSSNVRPHWFARWN